MEGEITKDLRPLFRRMGIRVGGGALATHAATDGHTYRQRADV